QQHDAGMAAGCHRGRKNYQALRSQPATEEDDLIWMGDPLRWLLTYGRVILRRPRQDHDRGGQRREQERPYEEVRHAWVLTRPTKSSPAVRSSRAAIRRRDGNASRKRTSARGRPYCARRRGIAR